MKSAKADRTDLMSSESNARGFHLNAEKISLQDLKACDLIFPVLLCGRGDNMSENKLVDYSMDLAVGVMKLCENIKGHYSVVNQLERSATSIGANIREGNSAHGKADFIAKFQIALKECYETEYWLELMNKADIINDDSAKRLLHTCGTIRRMLIASINTVKNNGK